MRRPVKPNAEPTTAKPEQNNTTQSSEKPDKIVSDVRVFRYLQLPDRKFKVEEIKPNSANISSSDRLVLVKKLAAVDFDYPDDNVNVAMVITKTSADRDIPVLIPNLAIGEDGKFQPTLILEPSAKAVAGNGGTAISAPVSRAVLRKNSGTKVYFHPESVAIAGVGGTAHAQADLILDYID